VPVLVAPGVASPALAWGLQAGLLLTGVLPVTLFLFAGGWASGRRRAGLWGAAAAATVLGSGLSLNNARAVWEGLSGPVGDWQRTPKSGSGEVPGTRYPAARGVTGGGELAVALALAGVAAVAWQARAHAALPFLLLASAGLMVVGAVSLGGSVRTGAVARDARGGGGD
jgi:hypothetical protein